ncbi:NnrU family protein [Pseudomonas sp. N040]|uniref:NnrU family protein n=1 Tax=Pseudomonas sp. N040 TaxID=2785325 RepID=UPI0018A27CDB|nr:NnrU family protein [Pseudomonas sp. N040]MBF7731095.1 NnrU family protein [Pseudomonas sp. N040]MBW7014738.1 NnrU family protein [Pseudomonas sp. N040]
MTYLVIGLLLFLGMHSVRMLADGWRSERIAAWGALPWRGFYSAVALLGFALIVWGYAQARLDAQPLWNLPAWGRGATALLMLASMLLLSAYAIKHSHIRLLVRHPMLWGVLLFALAHLLVNSSPADLLLFASFGLWAAFDLASCYRRDRLNQVVYPQPKWSATVINLVAGIILWVVFARVLHLWLIGVSPLG